MRHSTGAGHGNFMNGSSSFYLLLGQNKTKRRRLENLQYSGRNTPRITPPWRLLTMFVSVVQSFRFNNRLLYYSEFGVRMETRTLCKRKRTETGESCRETISGLGAQNRLEVSNVTRFSFSGRRKRRRRRSFSNDVSNGRREHTVEWA